MTQRHRPRAALMAILLALVVSAPPAAMGKRDLLRFAADMAKRGNWREARYRWNLVLEQDPDNPHVLNNLAVALEALGEPDEAGELYENAVALSAGDDRIAENARRNRRFVRDLERDGDGANEPRAPDHGSSERRARGKKHKPVQVVIRLPVPPPVDLAEYGNVLVASFVVPESELLDLNRELVRFLRSELRRRSPLQVLDVLPAPAVPEQSLDDLIANTEFWRHLGAEHEADLLLSGTGRFSRRDHSGFRQVDTISPTTGQKVRQTRFVERELFTVELDFLIFDGTTGELLHQDRVARSASFGGQLNDPLTAFYELGERIAEDVLATMTSQTREDVRIIFQS